MATFKVRSEHRDPDAPVALIEAFRVQPGPIHPRYRPLLHMSTGTTRMPSVGDWIVSGPGGDPVIMQHENFHANYQQAD